MGTGTADYAPNNLNQYATAGGVTQNYDGNGNLLFDGQSTYTYDAINRMTGAQTAEHTATYVFDSFDRRISKTVEGSGVTYLFDGDHIVAEYESGSLARKFVYGPGIDEPVMMIVGENRYFYHANEQGAVLALSNASGALAETYLYSPYGELGFEGALGNPYLNTGRRYDPETGLYYYRARMYSATQRRFLQPDPIGYLGGMNMYAYVGNNPVMFVDTDGLSPAGWLIRFTRGGFKEIRKLSYMEAVRARRNGQNMLPENKQVSEAIEKAAGGGSKGKGGRKNKKPRHKGHDLPDGTKGSPHHQTDGVRGHSIWGGIIVFIGSLLDPFDAISGELAGPEDDMINYDINCR